MQYQDFFRSFYKKCKLRKRIESPTNVHFFVFIDHKFRIYIYKYLNKNVHIDQDTVRLSNKHSRDIIQQHTLHYSTSIMCLEF